MRLPIDITKVSVLTIGEPRQVNQFGSNEPKLTPDGKPIYKVPVLLSGTGDRTDPTTTITTTGPIPELRKGHPLRCVNLVASTWTLRDDSGRERTGVTLRADSVVSAEVESKPAR
jgi:hypothetical protein